MISQLKQGFLLMFGPSEEIRGIGLKLRVSGLIGFLIDQLTSKVLFFVNSKILFKRKPSTRSARETNNDTRKDFSTTLLKSKSESSSKIDQKHKPTSRTKSYCKNKNQKKSNNT
jgi:hypothetical protein